MRKIISTFVLAAAALSSIPALAAPIVEHAWARATAPGQDNGSLQFTITVDRAAKIVAASSPVSASAEIHAMMHEAGQMKMRAVDDIALPAGKKVDLSRSGNHIMLMDLKKPLKVGDTVPFSLVLQYGDGSRESVDAKAEVREPGSEHDMHGMMGM
jgi:copper(I)-binding protein